MSTDDGWYPIGQRRPTPVAAEVELWGGPLDGERRVVADPDAALVLEQPVFAKDNLDDPVRTLQIVYRRREVGPDESDPYPIRFDYQPPVLA